MWGSEQSLSHLNLCPGMENTGKRRVTNYFDSTYLPTPYTCHRKSEAIAPPFQGKLPLTEVQHGPHGPSSLMRQCSMELTCTLTLNMWEEEITYNFFKDNQHRSLETNILHYMLLV